ncbi:hypothetical protein WR25_16499 [Diploscapter pachys]|uniref:Tn3 transposase DDE domain-containing protein n=1 Tax=Diploscapter pachys TaxID=2018661 RepID=A0A2A2JWP9_9BILA|nr:hypothetical protein WR25_16499 [Diploscapter pachys]
MTIERRYEGRRAGDPAALVADNRAILAALPWRPQRDDLDTIVKDALAWERKLVTCELNKGEAQNVFKRAIFFHRAVRIRDHGPQAQGYRASVLNPVASVIVLWDTTYLEAAMCHLDRQGRPVPPNLRQHLSPLRCCWRTVAMTPTGFARRWPRAAPRPASRHAKAARCRSSMMPPSTGVATGSRT